MAYRFDNYMSKGPWSIFLALFIVFMVGFILIGVIRYGAAFFIPDDVSTDLGIWRIFLQLTDPGNMAQDNDSFWYVKVFAIVSGMFGIIFFSAVIAFITTQLDIKLEELKKGKSKVLEKDHILILGWSSQIVEIIREVIIANESEKDGCVVVMSNEPKEEMDDFLNEQITDRLTTRIITRTGQTGSLTALERVASAQAKSVIILPTCAHGAESKELAHSDAHTLKATLAVIAASEGKGIPDMVVQVFNKSNERVIRGLAEQNITVVDPEDMVAKIAVQTSRSTGLSAVYASLIGFDGCEFYFTRAKWNGILFKDVHFHYPDGIALGYKDGAGEIHVNPSKDYILKDDDEIIILAEDDSTIDFKSKPVCTPKPFSIINKRLEKNKENILVIGWNNKGKTIIEQYEDYIVEGSSIDIVPVEENRDMEAAVSQFKSITKNTIDIKDINPFELDSISKLDPAHYDSIIILTSTDLEEERADANTINILLLLREVINQSKERGRKAPQIITEVLNSENLELISATGANDAIISTKMVSKILAQLAEDREILQVYDEIFEEDGSEIYLKPLDLYLENVPEELTFADLLNISQSRDEICLGYRSKAHLNDVSENFGIVINPPKDHSIKSADIEQVIVLAEDEL
jgi:Trk K+ transport system NAD-binding subunit